MFEVVVIVESGADARTATKLAERVLEEKIDWLEYENLKFLFKWSGLQENTNHSCWKDIEQIIEDAKKLTILILPYSSSRFDNTFWRYLFAISSALS